eukprot:TRINITY_DN17892_c0_g1_i5.p1 TRINITY_DN17892_c0_g1~~TRINITY_DN17892_c0_g1_i5.p1  ORF type:complete len:180 (+),score=5.66 TRINITY_DN17892_c0_g1_i5:234-773(+)
MKFLFYTTHSTRKHFTQSFSINPRNTILIFSSPFIISKNNLFNLYKQLPLAPKNEVLHDMLFYFYFSYITQTLSIHRHFLVPHYISSNLNLDQDNEPVHEDLLQEFEHDNLDDFGEGQQQFDEDGIVEGITDEENEESIPVYKERKKQNHASYQKQYGNQNGKRKKAFSLQNLTVKKRK